MNVAAKTVSYIRDGLRNVAIGLGTALDKSISTTYAFNLLDKGQLEAAYRGDWIARKIVDAPADDATREWRTWQAEGDTIGLIEETERRLKVQQKLRWAMKLARLYGGGALIPGIKNQGNTEQPLNLEKVKKDDFTSLHAVSQFDIARGPEMITDLESPWFGEPTYYVRNLVNVSNMQTTEIRIHPSRVIKLLGREIPDPLNAATLGGNLWGDSVLTAVDDAVKAAGTVSAGIAQLVTEAKVDVMKVEGLTENLTTVEYESRFIERLAMTDRIKSLMHKIVIDSKEELDRIEVNFSQLPDVLRMYLLIASGAADIPATRLLGQSAQGLNATGDSDMRNYYDRVKSDQVTTLTPAIEALDELILRSATGTRDEDLFYEWNPLWQMTDQEKADVSSKKADVMSKDVAAGLIPLEALRVGRQNQLIEDGTYPGLEQAIDDYDDEVAPAEETRQLALEQQQKLLAAPVPEEKEPAFGDADFEDREKFSAFVKVGPDKYKKKGGKGKIYSYEQVKLWYALHARGQAWDHTPGGHEHNQKSHAGEDDEGTSAVILTQIDKLAFEGGGSARMRDLPGGEEIVWSMIDKGWLERDEDYVNLTPAGKAILKKHGLKTWDHSIEDFNPNHYPAGPRGGQFAPSPGSLARERAAAMQAEEAGRAAYEARYAELYAKEKKRVAALPAFAQSRAPGETDKEFAKRVIDKRPLPAELPEDYDLYFNRTSDAQVVPLDDLVNSKSAEETLQTAGNAARRMVASANGEIAKRDPISVTPSGNKYRVLDGNSTVAAAREYRWTALPVRVSYTGDRDFDESKINRAKTVPGTNAGSFAPKSGTGVSYTDIPDEVYRVIKEDMSKPHPGPPTQPTQTLNEHFKLAEKDKRAFDETVKDMARLTNGEPDIPGLKGRERSIEKIRDELEGIDNRLLDVTRATIYYDTYAEARAGVARMKREYGDDVIRVKDRVKNPLEEGYRDMLVNYRMPSGQITEIQFNTKRMVHAKEHGGHDLYKKFRALPLGEQARQKSEYIRRSREHYERPYQESGNGRGWQ